MQVSCPNDIKIYNLSHGKSLPEFLSEHKRRALLKKDVDLRRRIELIQDFNMPTVCSTVKTSPDGQYIFATGTYKPRLKCFDGQQLSMKFERYLDAEAVNFLSLSDDYAKLALLLNDRSIEFHTQQGKHYKIRIPKFGRDLCYNSVNCDLMAVGAGSEVYRINLDQGRFLKPYETSMREMFTCTVSTDHQLLTVGGSDGTVECWDPRSRVRAGLLNVGPGLAPHIEGTFKMPNITCVKYHKAIEMAVGTSTGQVMMYDIRNDKPYMVKDHRYDLPIHSIFYNAENEAMVSSDSRVVKLWDVKTGNTKTAIETDHDINHMHLVENSGLIFLANESPKIFTYFIPWLGRAPKWCYNLDRLVEGQEEEQPQVYDHYQIVTKEELESLGLSNLVGTNMLRAYNHGYIMDIRLYQKAVAVAKPFVYDEYRKKKLAEKIAQKREENSLKIKKAPKVNRNLSQKLMDIATNDEEGLKGKKKKAKIEANNLLNDPRFSAMFENPDYQIDEESDQYRLLNPVISQKTSKKRKADLSSDEEEEEDEDESRSDHGDDSTSDDDSSSDEEEQRKWVQEAKKAHKSVYSKKAAAREIRQKEDSETVLRQEKMFKLRDNVSATGKIDFTTLNDLEKYGGKKAVKDRKRLNKIPLADRIKEEEKKGNNMVAESTSVSGGKQSTFYIKKNDKNTQKMEENKQHIAERRKVRRPADKLVKKKHNSFFKR